MNPVVGELRTPRLRLRAWASDDAAAMAAINGDPEATEYLNRPVDDDAVAGFHQLVTDHWERHGFGFYAVESAEGDMAGAFLGFVGVAYPSFLPAMAHRPELGWRLGRSAWGRGLATEAARAVCAMSFERLGFDEVITIIHPDNVRSQRVATKLGMAVEQQVENPILSMLVDVWSLAPRRGTGVRWTHPIPDAVGPVPRGRTPVPARSPRAADCRWWWCITLVVGPAAEPGR